MTGSDQAENLVEHAVPHGWGKMGDSDIQAFKIRLEADTTEADHVLMQELQQVSNWSASSGSAVVVKKEPAEIENDNTKADSEKFIVVRDVFKKGTHRRPGSVALFQRMPQWYQDTPNVEVERKADSGASSYSGPMA